MFYTAKDLIKVLGISKSMYASLINNNNIVCSHPATVRGTAHKYSKEDVQRNVVLLELINCGLPHKKAYRIANKVDTTREKSLIKLGTTSELSVLIQPLDI